MSNSRPNGSGISWILELVNLHIRLPIGNQPNQIDQFSMLELQGIAVSPGVAIGRALVFDREGYRITRCLVAVGEDEREWERFVDAVKQTYDKLETSRQSTTAKLGERLGNIFSAQQQILHDPHLQSELESLIRSKTYSKALSE